MTGGYYPAFAGLIGQVGRMMRLLRHPVEETRIARVFEWFLLAQCLYVTAHMLIYYAGVLGDGTVHVFGHNMAGRYEWMSPVQSVLAHTQVLAYWFALVLLRWRVLGFLPVLALAIGLRTYFWLVLTTEIGSGDIASDLATLNDLALIALTFFVFLARPRSD